jgi:5-formyltetrahydrofolate cyclo-ligase
MSNEKSNLRRALKQKRLSLTNAEHTLKSRAIVEKLKADIDWSVVKTVHYFEPIKELLEVDISGLVMHLEDDYPNIELFTPRLISGIWEMISIQEESVPDSFDIVIVPMLGFDNHLQRIGYGGGYYDKFLATQPHAKKIGVCFEVGKIDAVPAEMHDIPLDVIVTETNMVR